MIKNITRNIGIIGPLLVKVLCFINESKTGENQGFYKKRSFSKWITGSINNKEVSLTYDYATFIILDYNSRGKEKEFNKNKNIMIPIFQVPALIKFLRQSLKMFEYDDTYYYEAHGTDKKLCLYSESSKYITVSKMFIRDCMLSSQLTIVHFEYENKDYEGLRINNTSNDNYFELTLDQISELLYFLTNTDFITLSQTLVNSNILWISKYLISELGLSTGCSESIQENIRKAEEMRIRAINNAKPIQKTNVFDGLAANQIFNK